MLLALNGLGYPDVTSSPSWSGTSIAAGAAGAGAGITVGLTTGSVKRGSIAAAGAALAAMAPMTGPAAPFVAAVGGIVTGLATMFNGCGQTCTEATKYANRAAEAFEQIKSQYWAQPQRTRSSQTAALAALDAIAGELYAMCSNPALGTAGQKCISERLVRGGTAPWCPTPDKRGCDFFATFRDPIANDSGVVSDPVADQVAAALGVDAAGLPSGGSLLLLGAAALLLVGVMS